MNKHMPNRASSPRAAEASSRAHLTNAVRRMHSGVRLVVSLLISLGCATVAMAQPLLAPAEVAAKLGDPKLRIVDIREGKVDGKSAYEVGHIAGAQHAPYAKWRGRQKVPASCRRQDALTALIQQLGIDRSTPVVVVYEGKSSTDFGSAARVYWTLKAAGVPTLSVLNGGMTAWRAAGLPVSTETSTRSPSKFRSDARPPVDCNPR